MWIRSFFERCDRLRYSTIVVAAVCLATVAFSIGTNASVTGAAAAGQHKPGLFIKPAKSLSRATADRPDDVSGPQIHIVYAVPADGEDRHLDVNGSIEGSVSSFELWLARETGGRALRMDKYQGALDITFARLGKTGAELAARGRYVREGIEEQLNSMGFTAHDKIYAVYYDGVHDYTCGDAFWPPALQGRVVALYLRGLPNYERPCSTNQFVAANEAPQYLEYVMVHEIMHGLGFVPACAPHQYRAGHVTSPNNDLMWAGDVGYWEFPLKLDVGHDDYFDAHIPGCPDLSDSPYLTQLLSLSVTVSGSGRVTSSPAGIDCPPTCSGTFQGSTTLTAAPSAGAVFRGWTGSCTGTATCVVTHDGSVTATFGASSHRRTITLRVRGQHAAGALRVVDGYAPCRVRASVVVDRRGKHGWSIVRRMRTDSAGLFRMSIPRGRASYRARAPGTTANGQWCVEAVSHTVISSG
jgi:hypothetical protein